MFLDKNQYLTQVVIAKSVSWVPRAYRVFYFSLKKLACIIQYALDVDHSIRPELTVIEPRFL